MLTANEARQAVERAKALMEMERKNEATRKAKLEERRIADWKKNNGPLYQSKVTEAIYNASHNGKREVTVEMDPFGPQDFIGELRTKLEKEGYRTEYKSGTYKSDMGDFNAPCVIDVKYADLTVRW